MKKLLLLVVLTSVSVTSTFAREVNVNISSILTVTDASFVVDSSSFPKAASFLRTNTGNSYQVHCFDSGLTISTTDAVRGSGSFDGSEVLFKAVPSLSSYEQCQKLQSIITKASEKNPIEIEIFSETELKVRFIK
jgi:hypothetical protein